MSVYTVSELAALSRVSVRTLHHYDEIGLLKPALVGENGYRYYGEAELLRLQQILFHRELGLRLEDIRRALDAPDFDLKAALRAHRAHLAAQAKRYRALVRTLDQTLAALEGETEMDGSQMYRGFSPEKQAQYETWLEDRFGAAARPEIEASKARMAAMSPADYDDFLAELEAVEAALAKAMADGLPADGEAVSPLVARHHAWVAGAWKRTPDGPAYRTLADMYADHPDFRARYEGRASGFADYLVAAMRAFAESRLS
ncbi:MAG: MerR family transcriptional regulator [Phenylobacterium sp.]|uniref:MerR family transcriptional regulator n=1 Tax=Phenylobacterium sp. TaxID=1871053 RepID=UPI0025E17082|nr:MerR family transcriptional regulator [Phenylobacterium sp.]MBA4013408.1 MerR family transcriptional regulator [Phenylobacterium sp.]